MNRYRSMALLLAVAGSLLMGCGCEGESPSATRQPFPTCPDMEVIRLGGNGTELIYAPSLDRVLYLGRNGGHNALYLAPDVFTPAKPGTYIFRGSAYTWLAPQSSWRDDKGTPSIWPPDPAMDLGAMQIVKRGVMQFSVAGPRQRSGFQMNKRWELTGTGQITLECWLQVSPTAGLISIWSTSTTARGSVLALRPGPIRFSSPEFAAAWKSASRTQDGWLLVNTEQIAAGGKAFISSPPIIAAWHDGQWLLRRGSDATSPRHPDDTPLEIYISRDGGMIELELIGPYSGKHPEGSRWRERWDIVPAATPEPECLRPFL